MNSPFSARREIVEVGRRLAYAGMVSGTDGNISVRLSDNRIMVTPSGLAKGRLREDDMVIVSLDGQHIQGSLSPSSELAMHLAVYNSREEICACVHSHPPTVTGFAVAGISLPPDILPEVVVSVGEIPLIDYAPPGTQDLPNSLIPFLSNANAFLLMNHGLLTLGKSLEEAYNRHETVEHFAKILHIARSLGTVNRIPHDDYLRLETLRHEKERSAINSRYSESDNEY